MSGFSKNAKISTKKMKPTNSKKKHVHAAGLESQSPHGEFRFFVRRSQVFRLVAYIAEQDC